MGGSVVGGSVVLFYGRVEVSVGGSVVGGNVVWVEVSWVEVSCGWKCRWVEKTWNRFSWPLGTTLAREWLLQLHGQN